MKTEALVPQKRQWLWKGFVRYCFHYAGKNFHGVRLSKSSYKCPIGDGEPMIFVLNHPGWWDVILCMILSKRWKHYKHYAPIESKMLEKYGVFRRLGFFGLEPGLSGAKDFLKTVAAIFASPNSALWITAQGHFVDVRIRPVQLRPGVGHMASTMKSGWILPIAVEYPFWNESKPEALIRFGEPLAIEPGVDKSLWTKRIERALEESQNALAQEAMTRDPNLFEVLVSGKAGVGGIYDLWRRLKARLLGRKPDLKHME